MPAPSVVILNQIEEMIGDSLAKVNVPWDNTSFLERHLGELMREHDAHTIIAALLFNYFVLHTRLKHIDAEQGRLNND